MTTRFLKLSLLISGIVGLCFSSSALADADPRVLAHNFGILATILQDISIAMGITLFAAGMFKLKRFGQMRTFMSHQMTLAGPLMMLLAAVCLLMLPFILKTGMLAFWGETNPLRYTGGTDGYEAYMVPVLMFVRLIGIGSFMRGLMLVSRSGRIGGQPGTVGRAMIHIFAGILAIHVLGTVNLLMKIMDLA